MSFGGERLLHDFDRPELDAAREICGFPFMLAAARNNKEPRPKFQVVAFKNSPSKDPNVIRVVPQESRLIIIIMSIESLVRAYLPPSWSQFEPIVFVFWQLWMLMFFELESG